MKFKLYKIQRELKYAEESKVVKTQYLIAPTHQKYLWDFRYTFSLDNNNIAMANCPQKGHY